MDDHPDLAALRARVEEEERAYARLLAALDGLAVLPLSAESADLSPRMTRLNELWAPATPPPPAFPWRSVQRRMDARLAPTFQRQTDFNSTLVQALNGHLEETSRRHARLAELVSVLVQYLQHVL